MNEKKNFSNSTDARKPKISVPFPTHSEHWWRNAVIYNAYPRSFQDSNGDGIGDLIGITQRLDYLAWLGVDALWLNPITVSPDHDLGYDVSDYCNVHPDFGTLDDIDALIREAGRCGIRVLLDIVPSHTSEQHPWFQDALASPNSPYRDYYVWRNPKSDGTFPNNWLSYFGESAWTFDEKSGQYYFHNFKPQQPQLNWWNPKVVAEFDHIFRFWFDRGIAGFRIDALQTLLFDIDLRDNPPASSAETEKEQCLGQRFQYNANRPEVHNIIRGWRLLADSYEQPRALFGETWVPQIGMLAPYYGNGRDELDFAWNLPFISSGFSADALSSVINDTLRALPELAAPSWAVSTHDDAARAASRWCKEDERAIRCALLLLLMLPGVSILYYGDEIGMPDIPISRLAADRSWRHDARYRARGPMQWNDSDNAGFTSGTPWLPLAGMTPNVQQQHDERDSTLKFCRDLLRIRREAHVARVEFENREGLLTRACDLSFLAVNLSAVPQLCRIPRTGRIEIGTNRTRDGQRVEGDLTLQPFEGVIVRF